MSYDPTLPLEGTEMDAGQMRSQLLGLKALIDALVGVTGAVVDGVTTLGPGEVANATASVVGNTLHLSFAIPRGEVGEQGSSGATGEAGPMGAVGAPGLPFALAVVDGVSTLPAGEDATVGVSFDGANVHFQFAIPRGATGAAGEVSAAQLASAVAGTSGNTNAVMTLDTGMADADSEALRMKLNELIAAARR